MAYRRIVWTPERDAELRRLRCEEGLNWNACAARLGASAFQVANRGVVLGLPANIDAYRRQQLVLRVRRMAEDGVCAHAIAMKCGLTRGQLAAILASEWIDTADRDRPGYAPLPAFHPAALAILPHLQSLQTN